MKAAIIGHGKMGREIEKILLERGHRIGAVIDEANASELDAAHLAGIDVALEFTTPTRPTATSGRASTQGFRSSAARRAGQIVWRSCAAIAGKRRCALLRLELLPGRQPDVPPQPQAGPDDGALRRLRRTDRRDSPHTEKDAPSGTAITLAEGIISEIGRKTGWVNEPSDDLSQIVVTSLREGAVPGTHTVTYESDDDRIELKHTIKTAGHWLWAPSSLRSSSAAKRVSIRWTTC